MNLPGLDTPPVAADLSAALIRHLRNQSCGSIVMANTFVDGSPWESDVVKVSPAFYWVEYEIKVSLADYRADFGKKHMRWKADSLLKHEAYARKGPIDLGRYTIAKPKQFYFVVPFGMLEGVDVPPHCGIAEFRQADRTHNEIRVTRKAPNLKAPTKLDPKAVFSLAVKAAHRIPHRT